jgi:hypothetical protein
LLPERDKAGKMLVFRGTQRRGNPSNPVAITLQQEIFVI